jgi:hypothetical protein
LWVLGEVGDRQSAIAVLVQMERSIEVVGVGKDDGGLDYLYARILSYSLNL